MNSTTILSLLSSLTMSAWSGPPTPADHCDHEASIMVLVEVGRLLGSNLGGAVGDDPIPIHAAPGEAAFFPLDISAKGATRTERESIVRAFPRKREEVERLFERFAVAPWALPWLIEETSDELASAFDKRDEKRIRSATVRLTQFVTSAALPFNLTVRSMRWDERTVWWWSSESDREGGEHGTLKLRMHCELVRRLQTQLAYEVRVMPGRVKEIQRPAEAVIGLMIEGYADAEALANLDASTTTALGITDRASFVAHADAYYESISDRAAPVLESRIEAASVLAASLIRSAWVRAGRPSMRPSTTTEDSLATRLVGSRRSKVYHVESCSHAARIKDSNLIRFKSRAEVDRSGRFTL